MKQYKLLFKKRHPQDKVIEYLKKRGYKVTRANEVMLIIYEPLWPYEIIDIENIVKHPCKKYVHKRVYDFSYKVKKRESELEWDDDLWNPAKWVRIL